MATNSQKLNIVERVEFCVNLNAALVERCGYTKEAYARVVLNAMVSTPQLAECDPGSVQAALLDCLNAGLIPDGKEAAIVPIRNNQKGVTEAACWPMVPGRVKMAHQATPGLSLRAMAVYYDDEWEYSEGLYPKLHHIPSPTANTAAEKLIYVYAVARLPGVGEPQYDVMSRGTVDRYRAYSRSGDRGPWSTHFEEMAKGAVLKRLLKRLPRAGFSLRDIPELDNVDAVPDTVVQTGVDTSAGEIVDDRPPPTGTQTAPTTPQTNGRRRNTQPAAQPEATAPAPQENEPASGQVVDSQPPPADDDSPF